MKYILLAFTLLFSVLLHAQSAADSLDKPKVFSVSGMGFGFPVGNIKQTFYPKYSTSLGITIPFKKERAFIYPMIDFLSLGYNQDMGEEANPYILKKGSAKIYSLSVMPGINKFLGAANIYAFLGPSLHLVYEPRIEVNVPAQSAEIKKMVYLTPGAKVGVGAHYKIGTFYLFVETSWMHNFHEIQERNVDIITAHGGLKTDVTVLANKVIDFFKK